MTCEWGTSTADDDVCDEMGLNTMRVYMPPVDDPVVITYNYCAKHLEATLQKIMPEEAWK